MKITILGAGAMGSLYAALMAEGGHYVSIVDPWIDHLNEINKNGLRIEGASGERLVKNIKTYNCLLDVGKTDIYIIATKTSGVDIVAEKLARVMKKESLVVTIQNGLGSAEKVIQHISPKNVIVGVADGFGASVIKAGHVHHKAMNLIRLGQSKDLDIEKVKKVAKIWSNCGFTTKVFRDINRLIWEKFICNVTFSGPCTAFRCDLGTLMSEPDYWEIGLGCMKEAYEIGKKKEIYFSFKEPIQYVLSFGKRMPEAKPSMLLDHEAQRQSEIDAINGMVVRLGREMGIKTPFNQVITSLIISKEKKSGWR